MLSSQTIEIVSAAFGIMFKGMLGIFIFMLIFYLLIVVLKKIFPAKTEE